jgi:hypothetical protein
MSTESNMAAATVANQKAQKANPATPRKNHHPKGQGGRKNPPSKSNGNWNKSAKKPASTGKESASGNKQKHQGSLKAKHPAKNGSENDDKRPKCPPRTRLWATPAILFPEFTAK